MSSRLQNEIKQTRPFSSLYAEAYLNVLKTADQLSQEVSEVFKPHGLSQTQYNVLRILRGAGEKGMACREIGSRMITHDPDITRLLDRLETRELVVRQREEKDRRVVTTRITRQGLELLDRLEKPLDAAFDKFLGHIETQKLHSLIELLELVRTR